MEWWHGLICGLIIVIGYEARVWRVQADRDRWRREAGVAQGHRGELEREIENRCPAAPGDGWCTKYDGVAECAPCFVQGHDEVARDG